MRKKLGILLFSMILFLSQSVIADTDANSYLDNSAGNPPGWGGVGPGDMISQCSQSQFFTLHPCALGNSGPNGLYTYFYNGTVTYCPSPGVKNSHGVCYNPSPPCVAGTQKSLLVVDGTYPDNGAPTFQLSKGQPVSSANTPITVDEGGCTYALPSNPHNASVCHVSPSGILYCNYIATATGASVTTPDTAIDNNTVPQNTNNCTAPLLFVNGQCQVPEAKPGCMNTSLGDTVCPSTPKLNCGTVNGSEVCITDKGLNSNGYPASMIDGQVVADKSNVNGQVQNCVVNNAGKTICINSPVTSNCGPGAFFTCLETAPTSANPTPMTIPLSKDVQEVTKASTVTNSDGSKTVTSVTTNNIYNSTATTTVINYDSSGQQTGSTTTKGDSQGQGNTDGTSHAAGASYGGSGRFYTSSGKTVGSVSSAFMTNATNSPLLKAGQDIFAVSIPSVSSCSSCDLSLPDVMGLGTIFNQPFCASWMASFWVFISAALKVATVFMALRIMITPTF